MHSLYSFKYIIFYATYVNIICTPNLHMYVTVKFILYTRKEFSHVCLYNFENFQFYIIHIFNALSEKNIPM